MTIDIEALRSLSPAEKIDVIGILWDDLDREMPDLPLPAGVLDESRRRLDEMGTDPEASVSHEVIWRRIDGRA